MFLPFAPSGLKADSSSSGMDVLTLAPWVIAMRMPAMMFEMSTPWHAVGARRGGEGEKAVVEKTAAIFETYGAVQAEMIDVWNGFITDTMLGNTPNPTQFSRSLLGITDAGMEPMAKRVRANYRRLRKVQDSSIKKTLG